jgi:hypothetical protein
MFFSFGKVSQGEEKNLLAAYSRAHLLRRTGRKMDTNLSELGKL